MFRWSRAKISDELRENIICGKSKSKRFIFIRCLRLCCSWDVPQRLRNSNSTWYPSFSVRVFFAMTDFCVGPRRNSYRSRLPGSICEVKVCVRGPSLYNGPTAASDRPSFLRIRIGHFVRRDGTDSQIFWAVFASLEDRGSGIRKGSSVLRRLKARRTRSSRA